MADVTGSVEGTTGNDSYGSNSDTISGTHPALGESRQDICRPGASQRRYHMDMMDNQTLIIVDTLLS